MPLRRRRSRPPPKIAFQPHAAASSPASLAGALIPCEISEMGGIMNGLNLRFLLLFYLLFVKLWTINGPKLENIKIGYFYLYVISRLSYSQLIYILIYI